MFDRIMVRLVKKGSQEFVDTMDISSQLHALCSEQSVTVGAGKNTNCDKNGISDKQTESVQNVHTILNCKDNQESTGL